MPKGRSPRATSTSARRAPSPRPPTDPGFSVEYMDRAVRPEADFFRFATGTWQRQNPVPADKARWGAFDELLERNFTIVRGILEEAARSVSAPDGSPRWQVGAFFASALDGGRRERLRFRPIEPVLDRVERVSSVEELFRVVAELQRDGVDPAFDSYVYPDKRASEVYAFYLDQGGLSLPDRDYYLEPSFASVRAPTGSISSAACVCSGTRRAGSTGPWRRSSGSRPSSPGPAVPAPSCGTRRRTTTGSRSPSSWEGTPPSRGASTSGTARSGMSLT